MLSTTSQEPVIDAYITGLHRRLDLSLGSTLSLAPHHSHRVETFKSQLAASGLPRSSAFCERNRMVRTPQRPGGVATVACGRFGRKNLATTVHGHPTPPPIVYAGHCTSRSGVSPQRSSEGATAMRLVTTPLVRQPGTEAKRPHTTPPSYRSRLYHGGRSSNSSTREIRAEGSRIMQDGAKKETNLFNASLTQEKFLSPVIGFGRCDKMPNTGMFLTRFHRRAGGTAPCA